MTAYSLDHVALAVRRWAQAGPVLAERFGGRWTGGHSQPTFKPAQLRYADGMGVELLEPGSEPGAFVQRFLDGAQAPARSHHLTFKVRDIRAVLAAARSLGFEPILVNLGNPIWQEAFLHPKATGLGFLVQVAQSEGLPAELPANMPGAQPAPWPEPAAEAAALPVVVGRVANEDKARLVLRDLLGGAETTWGPGLSSYRWDGGSDLLLAADPDERPGLRLLGFRQDGAAAWEPSGALRAAEDEPVVPELGIRVADLAGESHDRLPDSVPATR
ncbi:VOC family protein [Nonomuraea wenchangensis]|uniref:Methylmalonyl-CoA/ethylmalonyl-CoA epimerase n=1 Tax=Nonomuraea wenchangensis TaxID=568860 RepID=A0A1I0KF89_9ACTN|nr:VOC family protein [Nonomuraea wenchangensis]SEU22418.1 methylmalonyl-CoA/ethylmalonyl-CoA epimerase [Nonomuraea wenchangensis]